MRKCLYAFMCIGLVILLPEIAKAQPVANFTSNITSGCSPILVQFTDQSTGTPTSWNWDLGNGTISTLQNPSTTYITPGMYTVTLTVTNASGTNTKTVTNYINAVPTPVVNFVASDSGVSCPPKTIQFTNQSTLGITGTASYLWDFGDGTTSTAANPVHTYSNLGNFSVTLNVTNSAGCSKIKTKINYIQLISKPTAGFIATNNNSCTLPLNVSFSNVSVGAVSYAWTFGDGGTSTAANPSHTYTSPGSYTVRLIATNAAGCKDTVNVPGFVNIGSLTASFTKSTSSTCTNNNVSFTNTSVPGAGNSTWYFGDGSSFTGANAIHAYSTPGTYTVKLVVNYNNCADSATQTVTVNQGPTTNFTATATSGCSVPFTTTFNNASTGATGYLWIFGDGGTSTAANPSHTYSALGVYTVKLVSYGANGCNDTLTKPNYINITQPIVSISTSSVEGCVPASKTFTATLVSGPPGGSYFWSFGDGATLTGGSTSSHTYTATGTYNVAVTYTIGGCTTTSPGLVIYVGSKPTSNFTATPANPCPLQNVVFTNNSTGAPGTIYTWYFGDGNTSNVFNPTYAYSSQGPYTPFLVAYNNGCADTFSMAVTVSPPIAQMAPVYSCTNRLQVSFNNTSQGGTTSAWTFGDGGTSTVATPTHTYASFGTYNATLTVTNQPSGCTSTHTVPVILYDLNAQFSASDTVICKGSSTNFTAVSSQYITEYKWNFGDGSIVTYTGSNNNTTSHVYATPGTYTVTLVVKDPRGCLDTMVRTSYIQVNAPIVNFTGSPLSGCSPLTVTFTDQSNAGASTIAARTWRFGDGTISVGNSATVSHLYTAGVYTVTLKVTDAAGCTDSMVKLNYVTAVKPTASFYSLDTNLCPGATANFVNTSAGTSLTYSWQFGDGGTSTLSSPSHAYALPGNYTVTLMVTDGGSCKDTLIRTAYIHVVGANLSFIASDTFATCPPLAVNFTNTSIGASNFSWKFGNSNLSTVANPTTIYTLPGVYTVVLKGQNSFGCLDSVTKTITVLGPFGTFTYSPINGCSPLTVQFSSVNTNTQQLIWDMNNGVTQTTTASTTTYTYTTPGVYVPKLLLSDGNSCIVPIQGPDTIKVDHVDADFSFVGNNACSSGIVQFTDTTLFAVNPIATRNWTFGDGGTSTSHNPSHLYTAPGTYTVTLIIGSSQGCKDTITKTITILPSPVVVAGNNVNICQNSNTPVQLQASGAVSYVWSPAATLSCTTCSNPIANTNNTTVYTVIGTAANGCTDTAQVSVIVNPLPTIQTGPSPTICENSSIQLAVSGAVTYSWSPATGLSCTNCPNPIANPATTTTYTVTGTSAAGCSNTAQVTVNVTPVPVVTATSSVSVMCVGGTSQLQASGATSYTWSPSAGLSCTTCSNPVATPATTTTYIVYGISGNGCSDTAQVTITVNPLPAVSAGNSQSICLGLPAQLQASGATSYSWSPATGLSCTNCSNPIANINTTNTYTVTGTDNNGCVNTSQVTVTVNSLPTITAGNDQTTCEGTAVPLQATGAQTYNWTPATGLSCSNCANPSANPASTTAYTVIGTDANGCKDTAQVTINVNPLPVVTAGADQYMCKLSSVQLQAGGATTYSWSPAIALSCNNCSNPIANPASTTTYTVTGTDANGCSNSDNVTVNLHPQPVISAGPDVTVCRGQAIPLQATGGVSYVWSPGTSLSCITCPNPSASPANNITYSVVGTDINGCRDSDQVNVTVIQMLPFTIGPGDTLCEGESTQLYVSGGDQYLWIPSTGLSSSTVNNPTATPAATTTYTVVIKQGICFADTSKITVVVNPQPTVNAGADQYILAGSTAQLFANATHTTMYNWTPADDLNCGDCQSPIATPNRTTTYTVFASNQYGCKAQDDVTIHVSCDNSLIFMANTFTPNGDGNNDRFYPQGKGIAKIQRFRVYDRWGNMVYDIQNISPNDEMAGWDGTYKGESLKPDVFVYLLDATCATGEPMQIKGDISLIR